MTPLPPGRRGGPSAALFLARVIYAFNWYNVGAVLPLIGVSFGAGAARLGIVLAAFLVGVGLFQVPAGFAALRFGARNVSLFGLGTMGVAALLSGAAPDYLTLAALRFVAGVGAAFFFSPGLSLIASYYPPGERGPIIGLYNGGFSVGGAAGLFGGALLGAVAGWPAALYVGGGALVVMTFLTAAVLPREEAPASVTIQQLWRSGSRVLRSRSIWALSVGLTGFWAAMFVIAQYFVQFGHDVHPGWGATVAAGLAATLVIVSFPGGPLGGAIAERGWDRRWTAAAFAAAAGGLVLSLPYAPFWILGPMFVVLGLFDGIVFAVLYVVPVYLEESSGAGLALGLALINSIQVLLGSAIAVGFGLVVVRYGYTVAWVVLGAVTLALLPLLAGVAPSNGAPRGEVL